MYEKFERLLKENNETAADVCKATGIKQNVISNWKNRDKDSSALSIRNLKKIADHFNVSLDYFVQ